MRFSPVNPERTAIAERRALATSAQTIRGTPFIAAVAALRSLAGGDAASEVLAQTATDESRLSMLSRYPLLDFLAFEDAAATRLSPIVGSYDEAIFRLGAAAVDLFFDSVAGRTMKILAGKDPHRMLAAAPNGYQVLVNFGKRDYQKTGERTGRFTFTGDLLGPVHSSGIFDAAFRMLHDIEPTIALTQSSAVDFSFDLSW